MDSFKTRLATISKTNGRVILANDYDVSEKNIVQKTITNITKLHRHLCGIKLNFHLLLPLGAKEIYKITKTAHRHGLQVIADIKLNDIGNTNQITTRYLWKLGFDAVIVNPIMGLESLKKLVSESHSSRKGVIALCHMSAPEAKLSYELPIRTKNYGKLYQLFLDWAIQSKSDGIIVGATFPDIIRYCKRKSTKKLDIFSPGIGTQGGDAKNAFSYGTNYIIVGRTIINAKNPISVAREFQLQSM